ncbi:hypothetical protein GUITHDRAFT_110143 [Guillardia theta CCMP2712]|uniref:Uncharacterized protein n=1 Tax=Guillardia theta (strain CCMP2712) TaxID=905079 RepID=L1J7I0_GUITC|nr:hypothetical protein GUITHDRAFT_110143 [Guillardia theta CCMP2712]EKX44040.1 hypothetical protein GUITHDRAFT_110143 [Guillardia theta CCMP2712]|eukprot:XP_005831020.1 hypothetical protein GUITHDRAFT_110143 [Guillardia theta CCMP2712]
MQPSLLGEISSTNPSCNEQSGKRRDRKFEYDAEDFRFHAVRSLAIKKCEKNKKKKSAASTNAEDGSSNAATPAKGGRKPMLKKESSFSEDLKCITIADILEDVVNHEGNLARSYVERTCTNLGIMELFPKLDEQLHEVEQQHPELASSDCGDDEVEEELSVSGMIHDNEEPPSCKSPPEKEGLPACSETC